jgi:adenylate cyclase
MDSVDHIKLAAFQELQEVLRIKRVNDELLEHLLSSLRWILHYAKKNNLDVPEKDKIITLLDKGMEISNKLPQSYPTKIYRGVEPTET